MWQLGSGTKLSDMKILVTGANGQLGNELHIQLDKEFPGSAIYTDIEELDLTDPKAVEAYIVNNDITHIINCAAYNAVDQAEEEKMLSARINNDAVKNLAIAADANGAKIIHISTDYVFDGTNYRPYRESDKVNPISQYGTTKRKGETSLLALSPEAIIIRTAWLYSSFGHNFLKVMLEKANTQTRELDNTSNDVDKILDSLKPTKLNKNNMVISNEDVQKIKNYAKDVKDITQTVRSVNDLNMAIKDFEHSAFEIEKENRSLKYEIELKDNEIASLKKELSTKDKIIGKLQTEKEKIKQELQKFKGFWHSIMNHFHKRICYDKDNNYKIVSDDLYKNGIFDNNDNEIANNIVRKVTIPDEKKPNKNKKKNNDTRF